MKPVSLFLLSIILMSFVFINNSDYSFTKDKNETDSDWTVQKDSVIKILAIGNSFSQDAVEYYLQDLVDAAGYQTMIGSVYSGGASLEGYLKNATEDNPVYNYRKIDADGRQNVEPEVTVKQAIQDEKWDYISFQQVSHKTGQYKTYEPALPKFFSYVESKVTNPQVTYMFHQIWAYAQSSDHPQFHKYNHDQMKMYNAIVDVVWKAIDLVPIDFVIPAGTAIQNGRSSNLGDHFNRDGYHLNSLGQYTVASTWFEQIFNEPVIGNSFKPDDLTDWEVDVAQHAAHQAIRSPKRVTELKDYALPAKPLRTPIFISFGSEKPLPEGWNALKGANGRLKGNTIADLQNYRGKSTGIHLEVTKPFFDNSTGGAKNAKTGFIKPIPNEVARYSLYGNAKKELELGNDFLKTEESEVVLSGLESRKTYSLCFFSSSLGRKKNCETKFTARGNNKKTTVIDADNNQYNTVCTKEVMPNNKGVIKVTITAGENNNTEHGLFYINAMEIRRE